MLRDDTPLASSISGSEGQDTLDSQDYMDHDLHEARMVRDDMENQMSAASTVSGRRRPLRLCIPQGKKHVD